MSSEPFDPWTPCPDCLPTPGRMVSVHRADHPDGRGAWLCTKCNRPVTSSPPALNPNPSFTTREALSPMTKTVEQLREEYERACAACGKSCYEIPGSGAKADWDAYKAMIDAYAALQQQERDKETEDAVTAICGSIPVTVWPMPAAGGHLTGWNPDRLFLAREILASLSRAGFSVRREGGEGK